MERLFFLKFQQYNGVMADIKKTKQLHWRILCLLLPLLLLTPAGSIATPQPAIHIQTPGQGSIVTSPIAIHAEITPDGNNLFRITLVDVENTLLSRQVFPINKPLTLDILLAFEIPGESTNARLILSLYDEYKRPESIRSVDLILQKNGEAILQTQPNPTPWLTLKHPLPLEHLEGGVVLVEGSINPPNSNPVIFELITETSGVISTALLYVPDANTNFDFELEIPYSYIHHKQKVLLIARQTGQNIPGDVILDSWEIMLSP